MIDFATKLINLRESHDWSKTYVANHLGLKNMQTYANWEYSKSEPDKDMLVKIAKLYDVSVDYLLGNSDLKASSDDGKVDLADAINNPALFSYQGKEIPLEDLEVIKRILDSRK